MPSKYCAFPGCCASATPKYDGVHFFQITTRKSEYYDYVGWKNRIVDILSKYRDIGPKEIDKIEKGKMYICSQHYEEKDIDISASGKWSPSLGALPTKNLPKKSHDTKPPTERRHLNIVKDFEEISHHDYVAYKHFNQFEKSIDKLKLADWSVVKTINSCHFKHFKTPFSLPYVEVIVDDKLEFTIIIFGWSLPQEHSIYSTYSRCLKSVTISRLLSEVMNLTLCEGIKTMVDVSAAIEHTIPHEFRLDTVMDGSPVLSKKFFRARDCCILNDINVNMCKPCTDLSTKEKKEFEKKQKHLEKPAHKNAPLSKTHRHRLELALKYDRIEHKISLKRLQREINEKGVDLQNQKELCDDFFQLMEKSKDTSPFVKLFWEQQKNLAKGNPHAIRYHPMIIRFCLSLASKSASAYDELRSSGLLTLPSRRTLRDYTNFIKPSTGFNPDVTNELIRLTSKFFGYQRFLCLSFDEFKIQEGLVFDKHSGNLVGFIDLGDDNMNNIGEKKLASHVMVFFLRTLTGNFKFSFSYFATDGMNSDQIMMLFWDAISILEFTCHLPVICCTSDGASPNRKFYRMHWLMDDAISDVIYRATNLFSKDGRFIYFFADVPHLMKTSRNCLFHSKAGGSRNLWNKDGCLMWDHIRQIVYDDMDRATKKMTKLSLNHIHLNPFSKMKVSYATQVLSSGVSKLLRKDYVGTNATANFCEIMDNFFDCLNVRHPDEHKFKRKPCLAPYIDQNDIRLNWLQNDFLQFFENWKMDIKTTYEGKLSVKEMDKMFISKETHEGLIITVRSFVELTRFLLGKGMQYFLSVNLNQDCTEEHFGIHRGCGRRSTNPNLYQFGYQENKIRIQKFSTKTTGNSSGRFNEKKKSNWFDVDEEPLAKRSVKKAEES